MTIKLVISDIDGTLVQHRPHSNDLAEADTTIPQSSVDAIARLHSKGIFVAGATGRTFEQARGILTSLGITGPCVFSGGSTIRSLPDGQVLYEATLADESVASVKAILSKYLADGRNIELNRSFLDPTKYTSIWAKLRKSDIDSAREELTEVPSIYFVMNDGHGHKTEFGVAVLSGGVNKGSATKNLLSMLSVYPSEAACIGDGANDAAMFNECGVSIAMGNGADELKIEADYVVSSIDNDGFAEAVDYIINSSNAIPKMRYT